ncbi:cellulase family glycosylhydrolase [Ruminococcus flavefaciens]|uniref:cellulase family glycosylhydrolase n=1 Tax=Ruminococcus flavefaciens TaxID=1265 RepID=UPI0026EA813F|nr:cellulase family glycosylhydrolase [Ruminococcus flavefaciens]
MATSFFKKLLAAVSAAAVVLVPASQPLPEKSTAVAAADDCHDDWLHVNDKAQIVDKDGKEVWLTGVNWFGYNAGRQVFDGVWSKNMHSMLNQIADHGFNLLRVPMSTQIILQWKNKGSDKGNGVGEVNMMVNAYENPELTLEGGVSGEGQYTLMYSFDIWNKAVEWCKENGMKIMIDIHSATSASMGHQKPLWYDDNFSEDDWLEALEWFTEYYKDDDTIIAIDLKNEPHGKPEEGTFAKWDDSKDANNWKYAAEKGAMACLKHNPNLLIMIEGTECYPDFEKGADWNTPAVDYAHYDEPSLIFGAWWGGNLRGVKDHPVDIGEYNKQIVYSPHDYGPLVWKQSWFYMDDDSKTFDRQSLLDDYWYDTWAYLVEEQKYPLLIGEWGGFIDKEHDPTGENKHWMQELRDYMIDKHINHTFWCFNENSGDTGGLVYDDFGKWDEEKYEFVKPSLWQTDGGKFIGLDHTIPLGQSGNGISLGDYFSGNTEPTPRTTATTAPKDTTTTTATKPATTTTSTATNTTTLKVTTTTTSTTTNTAQTCYLFDGVESYPTKTVYTEGDKLDLKGFKIKVHEDGKEMTTVEFTDTANIIIQQPNGAMISGDKFNTLEAGEYTIKISPTPLVYNNGSFTVKGADASYNVTIYKQIIGTKDNTVWGDANADGTVDMSDVVLIMQSLANPNKYGLSGTDKNHITSNGLLNASVIKRNGSVTTEDALQIQLFLLGKVTDLGPAS